MLVQVAETLSNAPTLATEIIKGVMVPQFVILPLAVLLVDGAGARHPPAQRAGAAHPCLPPDDLSPLDESFVPQEVAPLVASINDLLTPPQGLADHTEAVSGRCGAPAQDPAGRAAHAGRHGAARNPNAAEIHRSLQQIARSSVRATHTVNQLLALARAKPPAAPAHRNHRPGPPRHRGGARLSPRAMDKPDRPGLRRASEQPPECLMDSNPALLSELVRNLVDNAIHYTPTAAW